MAGMVIDNRVFTQTLKRPSMKIEQTSLVDYDEVNTQYQMKLPVLFQRLQRADIRVAHDVIDIGLEYVDRRVQARLVSDQAFVTFS